jgi:PucR family transcriptional regulator, purine catabolism regulatory protein
VFCPVAGRCLDVVSGLGRSQPNREDEITAPTVAEVLALPVLAAGLPRVVVGESGLDRTVRWVHVTELTDPASFLKGGELVLTTGVPLPKDASAVRRYVDELADVGAVALVLELVRRFHRPPDALVRACRARELPLITLSRDVNFVDVTQVVHALILGTQAEAMRRTRQIHDAFTALTLRGAGPEEVVRTAAEMSGHTVVLENLVHQALICEPAGAGIDEALTGWEQRSRQTPGCDRTEWSGPENWLVTPVEYRGERWGRVVMPTGQTAEDVTVLERTAMTLTIARLIHSTPWERRAHRALLRDIAEQRHRSTGETRTRAEALGLTIEGARFVAVQIDTDGDLEDRLTEELRHTPTPALVGELAPGRVGVLLLLRRAQEWRPPVERVSEIAHQADPQAVVTVGTEVDDLNHAARSFHEAARVSEAVLPGSPATPFHELSDLGLPHLLYTLREDVRVQDYVERHLSRLIDHDTRHGTDLVTTLRHYLDAAGNKTVAARHGGLSRQTLYERLRTIERLLERDLEPGDQRTQLHVALMALDVLRLH